MATYSLTAHRKVYGYVQREAKGEMNRNREERTMMRGTWDL